MRSAVLLILVCRLAAAQSSAIAGIVIDSVTRQPLPGVHITLRAAPLDGVPTDDTYGAMSGRDGRFSISGLPPSLYLVAGSRTGYVFAPTENGGVELKQGEQRTGFTIEMSSRATIAGRVTDEYGDPVQNLQVHAVPAGSNPQLRTGMSDVTDERGQFRMIGAPGKYYVVAQYNPPQVQISAVQSDGPEAAVYGTTYYPASDTKDRASQVEVAAGSDLTAIDVRLMRKRSFTISGQITGLPEHSPQYVFVPSVLLSSVGHQSYGFSGAQFFTASTDGTFSLVGLASGRYRLVGKVQSGAQELRSAPVEVNVDTASVGTVVLVLRTGETLAGVVEAPGGGAPKVGVRLETPDHSQTVETDAKGAFHIDQVFPEKYRMSVQPVPEGAYVKSIKLDDTEAANGVVDLSQGVNGARVKITIGSGAGTIEGRVVGDDGEPVRRELYVVVLASGEIDSQNMMKPVAGGEKFEFAGLKPGKYRLIAVAAGQDLSRENTLQATLSKAAEIEVHEGDRITRDIKVTTLE
jgi:hypothetical protein